MSEAHAVYRRSPEVVAASLGTKSFLLHVNDWVYLELNDSGSYIWSLLEEGSTLEGVTGKLTQEFAVDPEVCIDDSAQFLRELEQKHFVRVE